jgi:hypothetical protein
VVPGTDATMRAEPLPGESIGWEIVIDRTEDAPDARIMVMDEHGGRIRLTARQCQLLGTELVSERFSLIASIADMPVGDVQTPGRPDA